MLPLITVDEDPEGMVNVGAVTPALAVHSVPTQMNSADGRVRRSHVGSTGDDIGMGGGDRGGACRKGGMAGFKALKQLKGYRDAQFSALVPKREQYTATVVIELFWELGEQKSTSEFLISNVLKNRATIGGKVPDSFVLNAIKDRLESKTLFGIVPVREGLLEISRAWSK